MVYLAGDAEPSVIISAPSSRGLGRRPLKAVTPVRIRSGLLIRGRPLAESASRRPRGFLHRGTPPGPPMRGLRPAASVSVAELDDAEGGQADKEELDADGGEQDAE